MHHPEPIGRRRVLGLLPALVLPPPASAADVPADLGFAVWRNRRRVGTHTVRFAAEDGGLGVVSHALFSVSIGPIEVYRYDYRARETWRDGTLRAFAATTNNNDRRDYCRAERDGRVLRVQGSRTAPYAAPAGSLPATHWNRLELAADSINPENGILMPFTVTEEAASAPPGGGAPARCFALRGYAALDLWYTGATWAGMVVWAKDGARVEFRAEG
jgi:hypothetical protein